MPRSNKVAAKDHWWKDAGTVDAIAAGNPAFAHWLGFMGSAAPQSWQTLRQRCVLESAAGMFELGRRIAPKDFSFNRPLSELDEVGLSVVFSVVHPFHGMWRKWADYLCEEPLEPIIVRDAGQMAPLGSVSYTEWLQIKRPTSDATVTVKFLRKGASRRRVEMVLREQFGLKGDAPKHSEVSRFVERVEERYGISFHAKSTDEGDIRRIGHWSTIERLDEFAYWPREKVLPSYLRQAKHRAARLWEEARPHLTEWRDASNAFLADRQPRRRDPLTR